MTLTFPTSSIKEKKIEPVNNNLNMIYENRDLKFLRTGFKMSTLMEMIIYRNTICSHYSVTLKWNNSGTINADTYFEMYYLYILPTFGLEFFKNV